jgi:uncharacterized protein (UPF0264 family)
MKLGLGTHKLRMQLLVSVSDAAEAAAALDGGADIVDAKDPDSGPLGPVTLDAFEAIRHHVAGARPLSAALGDPADEPDAHRMAGAFARSGARFVKVGFLAAGDASDVRRLLTATVNGAADGTRGDVTGSAAIAVAYADHQSIVTPWQLIDIACHTGATGILLDTANKSGPGLLSLLPSEALRQWVHEASSSGLLVAIAGRLSHDDVMRVSDCGADIVGVRGAACVGGRTGRVSAEHVRRLKNVFAAHVV